MPSLIPFKDANILLYHPSTKHYFISSKLIFLFSLHYIVTVVDANFPYVGRISGIGAVVQSDFCRGD